MASAKREPMPIKGVWGGAPAGSRGRAHGQGVTGAKPPEAESSYSFGSPSSSTIYTLFIILQTVLSQKVVKIGRTQEILDIFHIILRQAHLLCGRFPTKLENRYSAGFFLAVPKLPMFVK